MNEWISPDAETEAAACRAALVAAQAELSKLSDDPDRQDIMRATLHAFIAVRAALKKASDEFKAQHPENHCHSIHVDDHHIVASAFCSEGDETHPFSIVGQRLCGFAAACILLQMESDMSSVVDDAEMYGSTCADAALAKIPPADKTP